MSDYNKLIQGGAAIEVDDYDLGYLKDGAALTTSSEMMYHTVQGINMHVGARDPQQNYEIVTTLSEITLGNLGRAWDFQNGADSTTAVFTDDFTDATNWEDGTNGTWSIDAGAMKCIPSSVTSGTRYLSDSEAIIPDYGVYAVQIKFKVSDKTKCSAGITDKAIALVWQCSTGLYKMGVDTCDVQPTMTDDTYQTWLIEHLANGNIRWYVDGTLIHTKAGTSEETNFGLRVLDTSDGTEYAHWDDMTVYRAAGFGGKNHKPTEPKVEIFGYVPGGSLYTRTILFDRCVAIPGGEVKSSDANETAIAITYHALYDSDNTRGGLISDAQS